MGVLPENEASQQLFNQGDNVDLPPKNMLAENQEKPASFGAAIPGCNQLRNCWLG